MSEEREISEERFLAALPDPGTQSSNHAVIILYLHQEKRKAEIRGTLEGMKLRDASLHLIVFIALKAEEISEGKACELTGLGRISVREKVQELPELACLKEARKEAFEAGRERVFAHERPEHGWEYPSFSDYLATQSAEKEG